MTTTKPWRESLDPKVPPSAEEKPGPRRAEKKGLLSRHWLVLTIVAVIALSGFVAR